MSKVGMKYILSFLAIFLLHQYAFSCSVPPDAYFYTPEELVSNSDGIFLAKVMSSVEIENKYAKHRPPAFSKVELKIIETLKGEKTGASIEMKGFNLDGEEAYDFGNHEIKEFWGQPMVGAGVAPGDCWAYGVYEVDATYLVFTGVGHMKAFEQIKDRAKDKWLAKIQDLTSGKD